jgi:hypothetical protein
MGPVAGSWGRDMADTTWDRCSAAMTVVGIVHELLRTGELDDLYEGHLANLRRYVARATGEMPDTREDLFSP